MTIIVNNIPPEVLEQIWEAATRNSPIRDTVSPREVIDIDYLQADRQHPDASISLLVNAVQIHTLQMFNKQQAIENGQG